MQLQLYNCCLVLHVQIFCLIVINAKNIKGPPIIREHPKSIIARRNDPVTLNCAVSGAHDIRWFRNGQRVISTRQNAHSHRIVLPDGSLFFLRVTNNKRDSDTGIYWCVATNRRGKVRSHNATLSVAFLEEFSPAESTVVATSGAKAALKCGPPNGLPKPRIRWKHRNSVVDYDTRRYPNLDGDLIFDSVLAQDAGEYICEASNLAGSQRSSVITLEVEEPHPQPSSRSRIANIHESIIIPCSDYGKKISNVTWKKKGGKIPISRSQIVKHHALQISNVAFSDSGEYFCESVDNLGIQMAAITLKVYQKPELVYRSPDQLVSSGGTFNVSCNISGNPKTLVVWKLPPNAGFPTYLIAGQSTGSFHSDNSSLLLVNNADKSKSGTYTCWGINSSSAVAAKSTVTVLKTFPPPLMGTRPQDLGRREGSTATFPCEASSELLPANITWWYKNGADPSNVKVQPSSFISILPIGALVIRNVSTTDAGVYTCKVASKAGSVLQEAVLEIDNLVIGSHPTRYVPRPAPPSKPVATSVTDSSIHISWKPNSKRSNREDVMYSIEMWTSPWPKWETVMSGVLEESSLITGLDPNQPYLFVAKALNQYGSESFPSPWSDIIFTSDGEVIDVDEGKYLRRRLAKVQVIFVSAHEISTGTVDLSWKVAGEIEKQINTFAVYIVQGSNLNRFVVFGSSSSYRLTDVPPNSSMTVFIAPIIGNQEGIPSNSIDVKTGYANEFQLTPLNVKASDFASGFIITWQDPQPPYPRIIGYKVLVASNGSTTFYSTNETSIKFNPRSANFTVKIAIVFDTGLGPWSDAKIFHSEPCCQDGETMPSVLYSPFHPAWFLYLLIPTGLFVILLSLLYLRYVRQKSAPPSVAQLASPVYYPDSTAFNQRDQIYDKKTWKPDADPRSVQLKPGPIVAEYAEPRCRYDDAEPYATTALLSPHCNYVDSHYSRRNGDPEKKLRVNWSTLLPPPPQEPPPVELSNWNSCEEVPGCDHCCHHDTHVYEHPCNAMPAAQSQYIVPHSQFTRFTSLQVPKKQESYLLEAKSSTH